MAENNLSHTIRKQELEVEFNGTESEALHLQRSMADICHNRLIPAIEDVLDRYVPSTLHLTIDRLDIDAGSVTLERLERDLPQMVNIALDKYFQELPQSSGRSDTLQNDPIERKTREQTISAAFIFFLKHGTLPWSFHLPSGSEFEELIQESLTKQEAGEDAFELIKRQVVEALASATSRKRLIQQFTPALLETLLALISPEGIAVIKRILPWLRRSDAAPVEMKLLEQKLWASAFASIASGSPLMEAALRREAGALVKVRGERGASLAAGPDSFWSQQSGRADEPQQVAHQEGTTPDSTSSESEGESHAKSGKSDQAKGLKEGAILSERPNDDRTTPGSSSSDEKELSHPQTGKEDQTASLTEPTNSSQKRGDSGEQAQKIVHHDNTAPDPETSKKEGQSDPVDIDDQAQSLLSPAASISQSEGSVAEENEARHQSTKAKEPVSLSVGEHPDAKAGIYTALAGLVLLHPFLPQLFRALGIADEHKLLQPDKAIYLLYFLATGRTDAKEYELVIPKMLCHFPLENAVESNSSLSVTEQEEAIALLCAVIGHWEVLKNTGTDGLRETFLKRPGKLSLLHHTEWLLQVETNSCDILLEQLPWGISMIRLPWMQEMLRVEWV